MHASIRLDRLGHHLFLGVTPLVDASCRRLDSLTSLHTLEVVASSRALTLALRTQDGFNLLGCPQALHVAVVTVHLVVVYRPLSLARTLIERLEASVSAHTYLSGRGLHGCKRAPSQLPCLALNA